jgi:hypothetical protein
MTLVRRIGWALLILAFALALTAASLRYAVGDEIADLAIIPLAGAMLLGIIALAISAAYRLSTGKVTLRPWLALKPALIIFFATLAFRFLVWAVFPSLERDLTGAVIHSLIFALAYSLYKTAYRKPA